jgi:hypothetical protein
MPVSAPFESSMAGPVVIQPIDPRAAGAAVVDDGPTAGGSRKRKAQSSTAGDAASAAETPSAAEPSAAPAAKVAKKPRATRKPADPAASTSTATAKKAKATKAVDGEGGKQPALAMVKCKDCEYTTQYPNTLARHILTHSGDKPFACPHCDHRANDKSNLQVINTPLCAPRA